MNSIENKTAQPSLSEPSSGPPTRRNAQWGIKWIGKPLLMPLLTLVGFLFAVGHHIFYMQYGGHQPSGSDSSSVFDTGSKSTGYLDQQAVKQIGNLFVFIVLATLQGAIREAYNQYAWTILRRESLSVSAIDKLFVLPSDVLSFFSLQVLGKAKIALLLGIFSWLLFLGGLTPAATLSVVPGVRGCVVDENVPVPNYSKAAWSEIHSLDTDNTLDPSAQMLKIASETAFNMAVKPPAFSTTNSTYQVQFYGPTVQCNDSTPDQQGAFKQFMAIYANNSGVLAADQVAGWEPVIGNPSVPGYLIFTAFSTTILAQEEALDSTGQYYQYNNWPAEGVTTTDMNLESGQQIWVQTANRSIVCYGVNASFNVGFEFTNGVGSVSYQSVDVLPGTSNNSYNGSNSIDYSLYMWDPTAPISNDAYFTSMIALGSTFFGNLSAENSTQNEITYNLLFGSVTSNILETGLAACDEIASNTWPLTGPGASGLVTFNVSSNQEPWMCRNRTIDRAIEDLANNITISMMSSLDFTQSVLTQVNRTEYPNVYKYNMVPLLVSYAAVVFVTLISISIGLIALLENGVYHDPNFSSVMATTRNPQLDALAEGSCLGASNNIKNAKLMYGALMTEHDGPDPRSYGDGDGGEYSARRHVAFGVEGSVLRLRKGDPCY